MQVIVLAIVVAERKRHTGNMRYAVWNNKGGVGKSFLSFILGSEIVVRNPDEHVILVDTCPQANLSEIVLGGNAMAHRSSKLCSEPSTGTR